MIWLFLSSGYALISCIVRLQSTLEPGAEKIDKKTQETAHWWGAKDSTRHDAKDTLQYYGALNIQDNKAPIIQDNSTVTLQKNSLTVCVCVFSWEGVFAESVKWGSAPDNTPTEWSPRSKRGPYTWTLTLQ